MNRQTCILITCPSITISTIEVILRKRNAKKLEANEKLKSGIFCVLESGICTGRICNPAPGIRNPQHGIQNLILSWITLHGAKCFTPNISMHIILTVPHTYTKVLKRRSCCKIKSLSGWRSFSLFLWLYCLIQGWNCKEKSDASHSYGLKSLGWSSRSPFGCLLLKMKII